MKKRSQLTADKALKIAQSAPRPATLPAFTIEKSAELRLLQQIAEVMFSAGYSAACVALLAPDGRRIATHTHMLRVGDCSANVELNARVIDKAIRSVVTDLDANAVDDQYYAEIGEDIGREMRTDLIKDLIKTNAL